MIQAVLLSVLVCLVGHGITVIVLLHVRTQWAPILLHAGSALMWHGIGLAILFLLGMMRYYWHSVAFFGLGAMTFVFGFGAAYKSVTLRVLVYVARNCATAAAIHDIYHRVVMPGFRERARLLTECGYASLDAEGYVLTAAGRQVVKRISLVRAILEVSSAGLYFKQPAYRLPK